jgi:hypothetical protein
MNYYFIFIVPFNPSLTPYMLWLIMVVSYTQVAECVIEFFNSFLACFYKQKGCLVFVTKRFGWNPMRRNMQKNLGFFAVGKVMLCVGGGSGAADTIGGERRAPERGELCNGKPLKGADYAYRKSLNLKGVLLKGADCSSHQVKRQGLISHIAKIRIAVNKRSSFE